MKKKIFIATAAGLSLVLLSASTSDNPADTQTTVKVNDWLVVGSPQYTFTPGAGSLFVGNQGSGYQTGDSSLTVGAGYYGGAEGWGSVAVGYSAKTQPSAGASFALGYDAVAYGYASMVFGAFSRSYGYGSTAFGYGSIAHGAGTMAVGRFNDVGTASSNDSQYSLHSDGHVFVVGNGEWGDTSNALVTKSSGETTLTNKYWDEAAPLADSNTDPYGAGEALVVEGHTVLKGNVIIAEAQGDISMGAFGQP